jgi:hypothetical protein
MWTGQLLDAAGRKGSIEVRFSRDRAVAVWSLRLFERDGSPVELEGESVVEGSLDESVRLESREDLPGGGSVVWRLELDPADAGVYARRALLGRYEARVEGSDLLLPVSRGVLALWHFE